MGLNQSKYSGGDVLPLRMDGYGAGGEGVAHLPDGMACFVQGGLRGETCLVRLDKVGKSAAWGHVEKVLQPAPCRIASDCPYDAHCGGCMTRHMCYEEELAFKRQKVEDCLRRIGGISLPVSTIHGARQTERYRNKVQFPISDGLIGFYAARTHAVTDIEDCLLQPAVCGRIRTAAKNLMLTYGVSAYDERTGKGLLRHLYVRTNRKGEALCCLLVNGKTLPKEAEWIAGLCAAAPELRGIVLGVNEKRNNVILGDVYRTLWGDDFLMDELCGLMFRLSVPSFYQVHTEQAEVLYRQALAFAALTGTETVLDLYCGIGTITLCLAREAKQVIGAEVVPEAVADARENARRNEIENAEFFCGDAGAVAAKLSENGIRPDVVTVDPPRKGLSEEVVVSIAEMGPKRLVYISCDPATLARDLKRLEGLGYQAIKAEAVDLFPHTSHVETVVLLSKGEIDSQKVRVEFSLENMDMSEFQKGATYDEIKAYVLEKFGMKVSSLYIFQVKRKYGLEVGENYNLPKSEGAKQPQCPPEKEKAIMAALLHFGMIE